MTDPGPARAKRLGRYARRLQPVYPEAMKRLRALAPPEGDAAVVRSILSGFEGAMANIDPFIKAAQAEHEEEGTGHYFAWADAASRAGTAAADHGFHDCSTFGNP